VTVAKPVCSLLILFSRTNVDEMDPEQPISPTFYEQLLRRYSFGKKLQSICKKRKAV
jgi:hypothetical protein